MDYPLLDMSKEQVEAVKRFNNNSEVGDQNANHWHALGQEVAGPGGVPSF